MSSEASSDAADIVAQYAAAAITDYCGLAGIVFLLYDYTITFGREVDLFWTRKLSGATVLFLANKYITLLNHLFDLSVDIGLHVDDKTCNLDVRLFSSVDYLQYVPWAAFSGIRAFALCKAYSLSMLIFLLSLAPLGANFSVNLYGVNDPSAGCGMGETISVSMSHKLTLVSRICVIAADGLLIAITLSQLPWRVMLSQNTPAMGRITSVLLRDGILYFGVLFMMNVLHIFFSLLDTTKDQITIFTEPLTAVLTSRFLLDLQEASQDSGTTVQDDVGGPTPPSGTLLFARVIGSLNSTITPSLYYGTDLSDEDVQCSRTDCSIELAQREFVNPDCESPGPAPSTSRE